MCIKHPKTTSFSCFNPILGASVLLKVLMQCINLAWIVNLKHCNTRPECSQAVRKALPSKTTEQDCLQCNITGLSKSVAHLTLHLSKDQQAQQSSHSQNDCTLLTRWPLL